MTLLAEQIFNNLFLWVGLIFILNPQKPTGCAVHTIHDRNSNDTFNVQSLDILRFDVDLA